MANLFQTLILHVMCDQELNLLVVDTWGVDIHILKKYLWCIKDINDYAIVINILDMAD